MKFSYEWIRRLTEGLETPPRNLERLITLKTAECEGVERWGLDGGCEAVVLSADPLPGGHNVRAVVDTKDYGRKTVVCGAPNCRPGMRTVYVPLGVKQIGGVDSDGMLASPQELGWNRDGSGIVELKPADSVPPADWVIEIDNKSLTHRPDLWGHFGMAREVAAITGAKLIDPVDTALLPEGGAPVQTGSEDAMLCPRFSALVWENVTVRESPPWLQQRLSAIGLHPINNIVDLTNFLMVELAQPTHAYDRALLRGAALWARPAREGETLKALNGETYSLGPANLVIADEAGPVGIAGVMGGAASAISEETTSIVLEAANFQAAGVRRTSAALKLRTDASVRFEKSQDPANTVRALARAVALMRELSPEARLVGGLADWSAPPEPLPSVRLDVSWLERKLGRAVGEAEVRTILERLGFTVAPDWTVTVPSWRGTKDISVADDLVEEVGRMVGYDSIPPQAPWVASTVPPDPPERLYRRRVRARCVGQGFTEVYNYSFLSEEQARELGFDPAALLRVINPIASNQTLMRPSLIPGIHANLQENRKHFPRFRLFEVGREIHPRAGQLPDEVPHLVAAIYGEEKALFQLKLLAESLAAEIRIEPREDAAVYEHPRRAGEVLAGGSRVGRLFEVHPRLIEGRAALLDLDLRALQPHEKTLAKYRPLRRFPSSGFDLTVIAKPRDLAGALEREMAELAGDLLESLEYVSEYAKSDRKSVTFRFTLSAPDHTLSSEEVSAVRQAVIAGMRGRGYELTV